MNRWIYTDRWIYTEDMGREQFYIADTVKGLRFVILDKHGIANIFDCMGELAKYFEGDLSCERECVEPYDTGIEGVDFLDVHFGIEEA
jgi:hypothetical protein